MLSPLDRVGGAANAPRIEFAGVAVRAVRCDRQPMPPGPQTDLQANSRRLQALRRGFLAGLAAALVVPLPALAQDDANRPASSPEAAPASRQETPEKPPREIAFEATTVSYDSGGDTVT